jgi:ceramide kinase
VISVGDDLESAVEAINYKPVIEETEAQEQGDCLMVHFVHRDSSCHHRWALRCLALRHHERDVLARWRLALNAYIRKYANDRPKSLLVFINPFGGVGASTSIFKKRVVPIFDLLGISYEAIETERADHAHDLIIDYPDLESKFDGIVCVGGDGIFNELFSGLLRRTSAQNRLNVNDLSAVLVRPSLRIGVVPGGSTDSVALAIHGTADIETATLHIVLGDRRCIDAASIFTEGRLQRFSMTMASYGYFGDLINRSEKYRWLGPKRYDVSGTHTFLLNRFYEGVVTYEKDATQVSDPMLRVPCTAHCPVCSADLGEAGHDAKRETIKAEVRGTFMVVTGCQTTCCSRVSRYYYSTSLIRGKTPSMGNYTNLELRMSNYFRRMFYFYCVTISLTHSVILNSRVKIASGNCNA